MSVWDGTLAALTTAKNVTDQQYNRNRQRVSLGIAREQQDILNQQHLNKQRKVDAQSTIGKIDAYLGARTTAWNQTDSDKLIDGRMDIVVDMFNNSPTAQSILRSELDDGTKVPAKITRFIDNGNGTYGAMVMLEGAREEVPLTEARNADGESMAVVFDREDLKKHVTSRYQEAVALGGNENTATMMSSREALQALEAKQAVLDAATVQISKQSDLSAFASEIDKIDVEEPGALEALLGAYKAIGGDEKELRETSEANALEAWKKANPPQKGAEEGDQYPAGSLAQRLTDEGLTKERWNELSQEEKDIVVDRLNSGQDLSRIWDATAGRIAASTSDVFSAPGKAIGSAYDSFKTSGVGRFFGMSDIDEFAKDSPNYSEAKEANEAEIDQQRVPVTAERVTQMFEGSPEEPSQGGQVPKGTGVSGRQVTYNDPVIAPPPFELTAENVKQAILSQTTEPTEEQKQGIKTFLQNRGIDTEAQLEEAVKKGEVNREELEMMAWVLGSTAEGSTKEKAALAQKIENLAFRGDQSVGTLQQAQLDSARAQGEAALRTAQVKRDELNFKLQKFDIEAIPAILKAGDASLEKVYAIMGAKVDGEWSTEGFKGNYDEAALKIGREISAFIPKIKLAQGGTSGAAGMQYLNLMLDQYLQAKVNSDVGQFGEKYADFFRKDADGSFSFDLSAVRIGQMKNGKPSVISYVDQEGVRSESVNIEDLQKDSKIVANLLVKAALANEELSKQATK